MIVNQPDDALGILEFVKVDLPLKRSVEADFNHPLRLIQHNEQAVSPGVVRQPGGVGFHPLDDDRPLGQRVLIEAQRLLRLAKRLAKQKKRCHENRFHPKKAAIYTAILPLSPKSYNETSRTDIRIELR